MAAARDADVAIRCTDLSVTRSSRTDGSVRVVDGVGFTLERGGALLVAGPTGSGKSSLLAALAGADEPGLAVAGGQALVHGVRVRAAGLAHRRLTYYVGYVPQGAGVRLPARLTAEEVIGAPVTSRDRRVNRTALAVRVAHLLDELMLPLGAGAKYPYELSAGMRQRVAIARALVLAPAVLIADDLLANVDAHARTAVVAAVQRRRHDSGMAVLLAGNDRALVDAFGADLLVLRDGYVVGCAGAAGGLVWTPDQRADDRVVAS